MKIGYTTKTGEGGAQTKVNRRPACATFSITQEEAEEELEGSPALIYQKRRRCKAPSCTNLTYRFTCTCRGTHGSMCFDVGRTKATARERYCGAGRAFRAPDLYDADGNLHSGVLGRSLATRARSCPTRTDYHCSHQIVSEERRRMWWVYCWTLAAEAACCRCFRGSRCRGHRSPILACAVVGMGGLRSSLVG
ncbi:hypothetical protein F5B18DRAFT_34431 [Nemania serpens]|nr:hypothetical protein F5B18DRAFT_34431 [Nemania serpens]